MSLVNAFVVPANELTDVGLQAIEMRRLGRFVAVAGRNGAGKSRVLSKVQDYVTRRAVGLRSANSYREQLNNLKLALQQRPEDTNAAQWKQRIDTLELELSHTFDRIITEVPDQQVVAIRFVPKVVDLVPPRALPMGELVGRYEQAKEPGLAGYEQKCLFYIQQLQYRWWNAEHQRFSGTSAQKADAIGDYETFEALIARLLGTDLSRDINGEPTLFGRPIPDASLSDGQKVILQLAVALHAQRQSLADAVFLLDEPENHLHPSAVIDLLQTLYAEAKNSQIWVATHSVPLLAYMASVEPMSLWFADNGHVSNAGRHPQKVLNSLLGGDERIGQLNSFTGLPAQLAAVNYALESLLPPGVIGTGQNDDQVSQIAGVLATLNRAGLPRVLDFGAGKGRLIQGIGAELRIKGYEAFSFIDYFAFDEYSQDRLECEKVIAANFSDTTKRYFSSREEFFSHREHGSIDVAVLCNVLHEISPVRWLSLFGSDGLLPSALATDGYALIVEDQRIPVGEGAHEYGFLVLDTSQLRLLFAVRDDDVLSKRFVWSDARGDGRLKAHLIHRSLFCRVTAESRTAALKELRTVSRMQIERVRTLSPTYANGQLHAFWTQQFANASIALGDLENM
jgi:ABC-type Mn2+/Zn2+ transport system ATPase subunit